MADLDDFTRKMEELQKLMDAEIPALVTTVALSAKALAERRIRETGFGAVYSTKKIPAWFLKDKELNQAGAAFIQDKIKYDEENTHVVDGFTVYASDYGTNWKEFREAQGLPTDHVDFGYTNKTWQSIAPGPVTQSNGIYTCHLVATNKEAQQKLDWGFARYGDIISKGLNDDDRKILKDIIDNGLNEITEKALRIR